MEFTRTKISEVILITPEIFEDDRGFFIETFRADKYLEYGIGPKFVQDSHSRSKHGVLRGLHYQIRHAQGKVVHTIVGEVFDVAVDIRKGSPSFGQWVGVVLSVENKKQLWMPPGFAHGFFVLSDWAEVIYKTTEYYSPEYERSIIWNDPTINIDWPLISDEEPLLSKKDSQGKNFSEAETYK